MKFFFSFRERGSVSSWMKIGIDVLCIAVVVCPSKWSEEDPRLPVVSKYCTQWISTVTPCGAAHGCWEHQGRGWRQAQVTRFSRGGVASTAEREGLREWAQGTQSGCLMGLGLYSGGWYVWEWDQVHDYTALWMYKMSLNYILKWKLLSCVWLFATPWT